MLQWTRRYGTPALFLVPSVVLLLLFRVVPMGQAFWLSLTHWDGYSAPQFIGFANFQALLQDPTFKTALINNALILLALPVWIGLPYVVAVLLHNRIWGWQSFRLAFFLPYILSPVIIGEYFEILLRFDGPVNKVLRALGLGSLAHQWLADYSTALPVMIAIIIWSTFGAGILFFLSALGNVNPELYDAVHVDGASWVQTQVAVTLPEIRPVAEFWAVVLLISSFTALFPIVYALTGGGPGTATTVIEFYIYQEGFQNGALGYASAVGVTLFLLVLVLVALQLRLFRQREDTPA